MIEDLHREARRAARATSGRRSSARSKGVEFMPISHQVEGGKGVLKIGDVVETEMEPYRGPDGSITTLQNSVFSTVPGSPAWIAKAGVNRVDLAPVRHDLGVLGPERDPVRVEDGARRVTHAPRLGRERPRPRAPRAVVVAIGVGLGARHRGRAQRVGARPAPRLADPSRAAVVGGPAPVPRRLAGDDRRDDAALEPAADPAVRGGQSTARSAPAECGAAFLGGYAVVWTAFGAHAFLGDVGVHAMVDSIPWLQHHTWLIAGGVLAMAGAFQFTDAEGAVPVEVPPPGSVPDVPLPARRRRRPSGSALGHGLYCLGCCWALMLVMFAAGVASLVVDGGAHGA